MQYKFDDLAASVLIDAINNTRVIYASETCVYFSNTATYMSYAMDVSSNVLKVENLHCAFGTEACLSFDGMNMFTLRGFSWGNKRRILKAIQAVSNAFTTKEAARHKALRDSLDIENLNIIIAKLKS